jgi:hypothetical protein
MDMERGGKQNSDTSNLDSRFELRKLTNVDRDGSSSLRRTDESSPGGPNSATEHPGKTVFRTFGFLECEEFGDTISLEFERRCLWYRSDEIHR